MAAPTIDILAIGAHPDDVEMTSGGYLALAGKQGKRTAILHLTCGEMGTRGTSAERKKEAEAAGSALGAVEVRFAGLQDGHVWCNEEQVAVVVRVLRELRPALVIAPWTTCHHPDHEEAAKIVIRACHFAGKTKYNDGSKDKPHNVAGLIHARYSSYFEPSFYVDVSPVIVQKRKAIECYASQFKPKAGEPETRLSNPSFLDQLLARGHSMGLSTGVEHAEAYRSAGALVLRDPHALFLDQASLPRMTR
ncbi:MAG: bacillithiol biosynthesis deacetylase BshB1 [Planctomycetes bacterium]|nr:bacillithiol biosynthesis deacetylase BshB1 [Planctomycetota bacterium]NUQ35466.1 bacillithiol biosynthesis deacetylase BshB1 [Planctomycetaceae bacterium]